MFGDDFCLIHGITRVFVLDFDNHIVALVSQLPYMKYEPYLMNSEDSWKTNIFTFTNHAAAPRWAMLAGAKQILASRNCSMQREGNYFTISWVEMSELRVNATGQPIFERVPYTSVSWAVMDK